MKEHKSERIGGTYTVGEDALTSEQVAQVLGQKELGFLEEGLLRLALNGGLRREDIVNVKQADVREGENLVSYYEKKKRRIWSCYVEDETVKALVRIKRATPSQWMFPAVNPRRHISSKTAYNILQRNLDSCGIPRRPFHALRSTCVKLCQRRGWTVEMAAKHIGDTVRVVQQHYSTPSLEEMRAAMKAKPIINGGVP